MPKAPKIHAVWRLPILMAERKIKTKTELQRRLAEFGVPLSSAQVGRIVDAEPMPERLNTKLLDALLNILGCGIEELIRVEGRPSVASAQPAASEETAKPHKAKAAAKQTKPLTDGQRLHVVGPQVTPFPLPKKKD